MDTHNTNRQRAEYGLAALKYYVETVRQEELEVFLREPAIDLVTDLLHLMARRAESPYGIVSMAVRHYEKETADEPALPLAPSDEEIEADLANPIDPEEFPF